MKWFDIIALRTSTIQILDNLVHSCTHFKPILFLQNHAALDINHLLPILTKFLSYVFPNIFKQPLNHTRLHFQTLPLTSNPNMHDLFVNQCQFSSQIHCLSTLFMALLFAIYRNLNSEVLPNTLEFSHNLNKNLKPMPVYHLQKILLPHYSGQTGSCAFMYLKNCNLT